MQSGQTPRYKLGDSIAAGAYAEVYSATDTKTGKTVVVKKTEKLFDGTRKNAVYALREAKIFSFLKHPNIISLCDIIPPAESEHDYSSLSLVFPEKMDANLSEILCSDEIYSDETIQYLFLQLLSAVQYLHDNGIIHRDLKPANILVNKDNTLKLCDFGMSRIIERNSETKSASDSPPPFFRQLTKHVITRWYRPPEVILEAGYSFPADMWSIGCILAQLLVMKIPANKRKVLFPGDYCATFSPKKKLNELSNELSMDQLTLIFSYLKPSNEDFDSICPDKTLQDSIRESFPPEPKKLEKRLSSIASEQAMDLLKRLLEINPNKRITAEQALNHPFLAAVKEKYKTTIPLFPVSSANLEALEAFEVDLEKQKEAKAYPTKETIRKLIWDEIKRYDPSTQNNLPVTRAPRFEKEKKEEQLAPLLVSQGQFSPKKKEPAESPKVEKASGCFACFRFCW